jgi:hypothetical protein
LVALEVQDFVEEYPRLFHMAEIDTWASIQEHGLLSTSALLDLYQVDGSDRVAIEREKRPEIVEIKCQGLPTARIRDQKPLSDSALEMVLLDNLKPADWYKILNGKVFLWSSEEKVHTLLTAKAYRDRPHDVITVDTARLVSQHIEEMTLCPYNSGSTIMNPVARGLGTFQRVLDYDFDHWRRRRGLSKAVTEVCVDYAIRPVDDLVIDVRRMHRDKVIEHLFARD